MSNFNEKYDIFVNELPKYVLKNIKSQIEEKYAVNSANEFTDALFERKYASYKKKREYDIAYYDNLQNKNFATTKKLSDEKERLARELALQSEALEKKRDETTILNKDFENLQRAYKDSLNIVKIVTEHHKNLGLPEISKKEQVDIRKKLKI